MIVMKHVEGVPWSRLEKEADDAPTSSDDPHLRHLEIFLQVCNAVSYAHAQGCVHRDVNPRNVMLSTRGETKLIDFGVAKAANRLAAGDRIHGVRDTTHARLT